MYAIVKTGGKQYKVSPGDIIKIDKIDGAAGNEITFEDILMVVADDKNIEIGKPYLSNVKIAGEIIKQSKDQKIIIFKSKRRKGYRKKTGHRQLLTEVKIKEIILN